MVNEEYSKALVEVLEILKYTDVNLKNKIPHKMLVFMQENASKDYQVEFNTSCRLNKLPLREKTKDILSMIYRNYWCDENERKVYDEILTKNENSYQNYLREKYNPDNLFQKNKLNTVKENLDVISIAKYKEPFISRLLNKIKNIFRK